MSGPPETLILVHDRQGNLLAIGREPNPLHVSPLEGALLELLARQAPEPVGRDTLAAQLEVSLAMLYRLIYRLRGKLGGEHLRHVGREASTREGRRHGFAGYQLTLPCLFR